MNTQTETAHVGNLTVFHLKIIAYMTMLIDHVGAFVIRPYTDANLETMGYRMMRILDNSYEACRIIGRIAFPLFCFMLVEGLFHTKNKAHYLMRLFIFALISEVPFDLVHRDTTMWEQQNVMFTLTIGLAVLICMEAIRKSALPQTVRDLLLFVPVVAGCVLAYYSKCDYSFKGVLAISALYLLYPLFHVERVAFALCGGILYFWEWISKLSRCTASLAFIPLLFYNGKKGRSAKWLFYLFYPAHLLILYFIGNALL